MHVVSKCPQRLYKGIWILFKICLLSWEASWLSLVCWEGYICFTILTGSELEDEGPSASWIFYHLPLKTICEPKLQVTSPCSLLSACGNPANNGKISAQNCRENAGLTAAFQIQEQIISPILVPYMTRTDTDIYHYKSVNAAHKQLKSWESLTKQFLFFIPMLNCSICCLR